MITVSWTTDKPTIGIAAGGSTTQVLSFGYYPLFSEVESGFGTSHSAAFAVPSGMTPVHFTAVAKDKAGNFSHTSDQTIA